MNSLVNRWFFFNRKIFIGTLYLIFRTFAGVVGTLLSLFIRLELTYPWHVVLSAAWFSESDEKSPSTPNNILLMSSDKKLISDGEKEADSKNSLRSQYKPKIAAGISFLDKGNLEEVIERFNTWCLTRGLECRELESVGREVPSYFNLTEVTHVIVCPLDMTHEQFCVYIPELTEHTFIHIIGHINTAENNLKMPFAIEVLFRKFWKAAKTILRA